MACIRHITQTLNNLRVNPQILYQAPQLQLLLTKPPTATTTRTLSTTNICQKRTPATVGVMSWIRMSRRRKFLERQMKWKEKSEQQILREEQLARSEPSVQFRLPAKTRSRIDTGVSHRLHYTPEVFLSRDRETIVCYHPRMKDHPYELTKPAIGLDVYGLHAEKKKELAATLSEEQIEEGKMLRERDPLMWEHNHLAALFKVNKPTVEKLVPLTRELEVRAKAEAVLIAEMSRSKRRRIAILQEADRKEYVEDTGRNYEEFANMFYRPKMKKGTRGMPIPPKH